MNKMGIDNWIYRMMLFCALELMVFVDGFAQISTDTIADYGSYTSDFNSDTPDMSNIFQHMKDIVSYVNTKSETKNACDWDILDIETLTKRLGIYPHIVNRNYVFVIDYYWYGTYPAVQNWAIVIQDTTKLEVYTGHIQPRTNRDFMSKDTFYGKCGVIDTIFSNPAYHTCELVKHSLINNCVAKYLIVDKAGKLINSFIKTDSDNEAEIMDDIVLKLRELMDYARCPLEFRLRLED